MVHSSENIRNSITIPDACIEFYLPRLTPYTELLDSTGILHAGVSQLVDGFEISRSQPTRHMVLVTVAGFGALTTQAEPLRLGPGTVLIVPAGVPHSIRPDRRNWTIVWFYLAPLSPGGAKDWATLRSSKVSVSSAPTADELKALCEGFIVEHDHLSNKRDAIQNPADTHEVCDAYAAAIVAYLRRYLHGAYAMAEFGRRYDRIHRLTSAVRRDPAYRWSVQRLAELVGLSSAQLHRDAKATIGRSPWQEVIRIRMEIAHSLLTATDYPLKLIASRVGYSDSFVFSTAFKNHFGRCPRDVRQAESRADRSDTDSPEPVAEFQMGMRVATIRES